jgi:hypothetical protein
MWNEIVEAQFEVLSQHLPEGTYCDVHTVGKLTTVARQTPRDMFSMWSDPSLLPNNGKAAFSTGSVPRQ